MNLLIAAAAVALATPAATPGLLARAVDPNPGLKAYTASAQLSATLHAVIPVHRVFNGTVTYQKPRRTIVFQNVSGPLSRFKELTTSTPSYDEAVAEYAITLLSDDGKTTRYSLVPKKSGSRIKSLIVGVDDQSALITHAKWNYNNGGELSVDESFMDVSSFHLTSRAEISARFPGYSVDGTITFSNYQLQ